MREFLLRLIPNRAPHIWVSLFFRWYDLWIGVYIDRHGQAIYICPLPMVGIKIRWAMEDV